MPNDDRASAVLRVPPARAIWRGLTHRCPVCAERRLFRSYYKIREACPRCGLPFDRHEGQWSGDIGINTVVTFTLLYLVMLGGTLVMWGDLNIALLAALSGLVAIVFPALFVPVAKTLWIGIDVATHPVPLAELEPAYRGGHPASPDKKGHRA